MATKSQFINRPWIGWFNDADLVEVQSLTNNSSDGVAFNATAHGYVTNDDIQFISMRTRAVGGVHGKQVDKLKAYRSLGFKGERPVTGSGIIRLNDNLFWFGANEFPFSGDARGFVVKPVFRSDWVAAFNPVIYEFVRGDDNVATITATSPFTFTVGTLASGDFPANRKVHFRESFRNDGVFTVASASGTPASVVMNENIPQKENDFGLIVVDELNVNYRLEVEVFRIDIDGVDADENLTPNALIFQSPQNGEIIIDISSILASQFDFGNDHPLTIDKDLGIVDDHGRYVKFFIKTLEKWDGSSEVQVSDKTIFSGFACAASLDQNSRYGSNMGEYVMNTNVPANRGLFLTQMERPSIWRNWPFAIYFIWDDATDATATREEFNAVDGSLGTVNSTLSTTSSFARWLLRTDNFQAATVTLDLFIQASAVERSIRLPVDILEECPNPVMLEWVNSKGGDCFWLFDFNHERTVKAESIDEILKATVNYFQSEERYTQTGGERLEDLTLFANQVLPENWEALSEIIHSPRVNLITQIADSKAFRRVSVRVLSRTLTRDVKDARYNFRVVVGLPMREAQK